MLVFLKAYPLKCSWMLTSSWAKKVSWPGKFGRPVSKARKTYFSKDFWEAWFCCCECESPESGIEVHAAFLLYSVPSVYLEKDRYTHSSLCFALRWRRTPGAVRYWHSCVVPALSREYIMFQRISFQDPLQCWPCSNQQSDLFSIWTHEAEGHLASLLCCLWVVWPKVNCGHQWRKSVRNVFLSLCVSWCQHFEKDLFSFSLWSI